MLIPLEKRGDIVIMANGNNIVKVRDDYEPIEFCMHEAPEGDRIFRVTSDQLPD